ncbi:MAG: DMT family transporter, partial [Deltaproteobacteria bacterium]|nr:DMT family transporter [Deltaproteobacteria bacterium]
TLFVKSVHQIGAARAQAINNSSPFVTVLLAGFLLGESLTIFVVSGVVLILSGVYFAAEPVPTLDGQSHRHKITSASILATLCYGVVPVLKKFGTETGAPPVLGALVMHATGLLFLVALGSLLKIELKWEKIRLHSFSCFVAAGVLYALGSIMTLRALVYAPASIVAPIWSAQPIVSSFLAKAALKGIEKVGFKDGIAAALVVAGVLVLRLG